VVLQQVRRKPNASDRGEPYCNTTNTLPFCVVRPSESPRRDSFPQRVHSHACCPSCLCCGTWSRCRSRKLPGWARVRCATWRSRTSSRPCCSQTCFVRRGIRKDQAFPGSCNPNPQGRPRRDRFPTVRRGEPAPARSASSSSCSPLVIEERMVGSKAMSWFVLQ